MKIMTWSVMGNNNLLGKQHEKGLENETCTGAIKKAMIITVI